MNEDITSNRHGGNAESRKAHKDGDKKKDKQTVFELFQKEYPRGLILDEVAEKMGRTPNSLSGRVTELKKEGLIEPNGERRKTRTGSTAAVLVVAKNINPWQLPLS